MTFFASFRYIDDVLIVWLGPVEVTNKLVKCVEPDNFNFKLTSTVDLTSVTFLDISIRLNNGQMDIYSYRKPTTTNDLLHAMNDYF